MRAWMGRWRGGLGRWAEGIWGPGVGCGEPWGGRNPWGPPHLPHILFLFLPPPLFLPPLAPPLLHFSCPPHSSSLHLHLSCAPSPSSHLPPPHTCFSLCTHLPSLCPSSSSCLSSSPHPPPPPDLQCSCPSSSLWPPTFLILLLFLTPSSSSCSFTFSTCPTSHTLLFVPPPPHLLFIAPSSSSWAFIFLPPFSSPLPCPASAPPSPLLHAPPLPHTHSSCLLFLTPSSSSCPFSSSLPPSLSHAFLLLVALPLLHTFLLLMLHLFFFAPSSFLWLFIFFLPFSPSSPPPPPLPLSSPPALNRHRS